MKNCAASKSTQLFPLNWFLLTVESQVIMCVTNSTINFFPKGHSTYVSKIPLIGNLKRSAFASKWDRLALATFIIFTSRMRNWGNLVEQTRAVPLTLPAFFLSWSCPNVWGWIPNVVWWIGIGHREKLYFEQRIYLQSKN